MEWINLSPDREQWRVLIYIIIALMFRKGWTIYWLVSVHQLHKISTTQLKFQIFTHWTRIIGFTIGLIHFAFPSNYIHKIGF